ncbi:serine hydrolase [Lachnospiraceae bacterium 54-53]
MRKKLRRLWSIAAGFSILAAIPSYGTVPVVQPFPGATGNTEVSAGPSGGTAGESGPGATAPAQTETGSQTAAAANAARPEIQSEGAVLLDAADGTLLFSQNGDTRYYPASITKLMTALLVAEKCGLSDTVTFSKTATTNLESGAVTLGLVEGDKLTVEQCLYGLMLKSANEVANGLAEHAGGSISGFSALMNARAKELGCTGTNFVNPNGLNNSGHYTTPRDMALIARAAFQNDTVRKVTSTLTYQIPATKKASARTITMGHKMLNSGDSRYYPGVIGGKTGYTSLAGNTLVTCAEKNGVRLIAVVMKSKSTHYADTKALLDYGFALKSAGGTGLSASSSSGWSQTGTKWYYIKPDGKKACSEWQKIDGVYYWFDSDSAMATGWREFTGGVWYYFRSSGAMALDYWVESGGKWYYLGMDGAMLKNTTAPGGYRLDSSGVWIP